MTNATTIEPRLAHPVVLIPEAMKALHALSRSAEHDDLPPVTRALVELRASQINGCSVCAEMHSRQLKEAGERDQRIWTVAAWREAPFFTGAERAALALTEAMTRIADNPEAVSDEIWEDAARHYDETALAALLLDIASINVWNRLNAATRTPAGGSW